MKGLRVLYLCYFGLREPLVQTQVIPYLRELVKGGCDAHLLTFEADPVSEWPAGEEERRTAQLASQGIRWLHRVYHKRPTVPATVLDVVIGAWTASRLARKEGIQVFHARSHVPGFMGLIAKRLVGGKLVFDIRGFLPEEYVDAGTWPKDGWVFRLVKRAESRILRGADGFVVLTEKAREILFPEVRDGKSEKRPVEVIPCCVDFDRFAAVPAETRSRIRSELGVDNRTVIVYVGTLGGCYLTEQIGQFLSLAHRRNPQTFSLILTQSNSEAIREQLRASGVSDQDVLIRSAQPTEIPGFLQAADLAISFVKPCFSKLSMSPTKLGEYLASGLPVICNPGIGDVDEVVSTDRVGVLLEDFSEKGYLSALENIEQLQSEPGIRERCQESARTRFDLETVGGHRYRNLYRRMIEGTEWR